MGDDVQSWVRRISSAMAAVAVLALLGACKEPPGLSAPHDPGFAPVPPAAGLVTNEWASRHPGSSQAATNPDWEVTGGSLFARDDAYWTGVPDVRDPGPASVGATNSAAFRVVSRRADLEASKVQVQVRVNGMTSTASTPRADGDGVQLFLRYKGGDSTYYASVVRRDGGVAVRKKCPGVRGAPPTYHTVAQARGAAPRAGVWVATEVTVTTQADGGVHFLVMRDGQEALAATDRGAGCSVIVGKGRVGLRGDNTDFDFKSFVVES